MAVTVTEEIKKECERLCKIKADADDLKQVAFFKFITKAHTIRQVGAEKSWVRNVIRNAYVDQRRKQTRETPFSMLNDSSATYSANYQDSILSVAGLESEKEMKRTIDRLTRVLDPVEKQVLEMSSFQGYRAKEICETLKLSPNAVAKTKNRAIKKMREAVKISDCPPSWLN